LILITLIIYTYCSNKSHKSKSHQRL